MRRHAPVATETPGKKRRVPFKNGGQPAWSVAHAFSPQRQWIEDGDFAPERPRGGAYQLLEPDAGRRDYATRRTAYARSGMPEYWLIDPRNQRIAVPALEGRTFREPGVFLPGQQTSGVVLPGFQVAVQSELVTLSVPACPPRRMPSDNILPGDASCPTTRLQSAI